MKLLSRIAAAEKRGVGLLQARPDPVTGEPSPFKEPVWHAAALYAVIGLAWWASVRLQRGASISRAETSEALVRWDATIDPAKKAAVLSFAGQAIEVLQPSARKDGEGTEEYLQRVAEEERKGMRGLSKRTLRNAVSTFEKKANEVLSPEQATDATDDFIGQILEYMSEKIEGLPQGEGNEQKRALYKTLSNDLLFGRWYTELEKAAQHAARRAKVEKVVSAKGAEQQELAAEILQTGSVRALRDMPQILASARKNKTSVLEGIKESFIKDVYGAKKEATSDVEKAGGIVGATQGFEVVVKGPAQIAYERGGGIAMAKASKIDDIIDEVGHQPFLWTRDGRQLLVLRKNEIKTEAEDDTRAGRKLKVKKGEARYPKVAITRNVTTFYAVDPEQWEMARARAPKGAKDDVIYEVYKATAPEVDVPDELEKLLKKMAKPRVIKRIPIPADQEYTPEQLAKLEKTVEAVTPAAIIRRVQKQEDEGAVERAIEEVESGSDLGRDQIELLDEGLETSEFVDEVSRRLQGERVEAIASLRQVIPEISSLVSEDADKTVTDQELSQIRGVLGRLNQGDFSVIKKSALKNLVEAERARLIRKSQEMAEKGQIAEPLGPRKALEMAESLVRRNVAQKVGALVKNVEVELDSRRLNEEIARELSFVDPRRARTGRGLTYAQMLDLELSRERFPHGAASSSGAFLRKLDKWRVARRPDESLESYNERRARAAVRIKAEEEPRLGTTILKDAELLQRARNKVISDLEQVVALERTIRSSSDPKVAALLPKVSGLRQQIVRMNRAIEPRLVDEDAIKKVRALQKEIAQVEVRLASAPEGSRDKDRLEFVLVEMYGRRDKLVENQPRVLEIAESLEEKSARQEEIERNKAEIIAAAGEWEKAYEQDLASKHPVSFDEKLEAKYGPMVLRKNRERLLRDLSLAEQRQKGYELATTRLLLRKLQDYVPPTFGLTEQGEQTLGSRERFLQVTGRIGTSKDAPRIVKRLSGRAPEQIVSPSDVFGQKLRLVEASAADRELAVRVVASTLDEYLRSQKNLDNLQSELASLNKKIETYAQKHEGNAPEGREQAQQLVAGKVKKWRGRSAYRVLSPEGGGGFGEIQEPIDYWIRFYTYADAIADAKKKNELSQQMLEGMGVAIPKDTSSFADALGRMAAAKSKQDKDAAVEFFAQVPELSRAVFATAERRAAAKKGQ